MKKKRKLTALLLSALLVLGFAFAGCSNTETDIEAEPTTAQDGITPEIEQQVNEIIADTPACPGWAPSIGQMVNAVFHDYSWSVTPYGSGEDTSEYLVKIRGTYSPTPEMPNISQPGMIQYYVNLETKEVRIYSDPDNLYSVFLIYIVN